MSESPGSNLRERKDNRERVQEEVEYLVDKYGQAMTIRRSKRA